VDLIEELKEAGRIADEDSFRRDLLDAVRTRAPANPTKDDLDFAFVCEVAARLADAEEFQDFIPCSYKGTGQRGKKIRVDGYEVDEADDSIRLLIADFKGEPEIEPLNRARAESVFSQLRSFVEESANGREFTNEEKTLLQTAELSRLIESKHAIREGDSRSISRYRFYMIADSNLSDRLKDLPVQNLDGVPIEFHIWDIGRLKAVASSMLGTEELEIDFTEYVKGGLPCLSASQTADYEGYLCVVPGNALADIYDRFGSKLLEGNVRSFLSSTGKINKGIQSTIRKEPGRFFVYNNGISATATSAVIRTSEGGERLISARYLQIVNGGQTTASLQLAKRKDRADLSSIHIQMKLSVVKAQDSEMLDAMIQNIARFSNSQNKVSDADFFSNHPFHRAIERRSRQVKAPAVRGAQFNTHWFYERARGQYVNEQQKLTIAQKKTFQQVNPRGQMISKTDLAKSENSFRRLPHIVSRGAQKNFLNFADLVTKEYGSDGAVFDNDSYFKEIVAHIIINKYVDRMVLAAKASWYGGDYKAQIVAYTIALLVQTIEGQGQRKVLDLKSIWLKQVVSNALAQQLEDIAKVVSTAVTNPPVQSMNVGEWCKKEDCWLSVQRLDVSLNGAFENELIPIEQANEARVEGRKQGEQDSAINSVLEVVRLRGVGCWGKLMQWSHLYSPIYGVEADLVRNASSGRWVPTDRQAARLIQVLRRLEQEGFSVD